MPSPAPLLAARSRRFTADALFRHLSTAAALSVVLMLVLLVGVMVASSIPSFKEFGWKFLIGTEWRPNELVVPVKDAAGHLVRDEDGETVTRTIPPAFGALPVVYGTVVSSALALLMAVPVSFGAALFLVRIPWRKAAGPLSFLIEFLAAVPSLAYGLWGLFALAPLLQNHVEPWLAKVIAAVPEIHLFGHSFGLGFLIEYTAETGQTAHFAQTGRDMLCGSLVLAIMILPIITSISRDVLMAVPRAQIEGVQAMGGNWWQTSREMLKFSKSGLFGAAMLGLARAAGETMAVTLVIGNTNQIRPSVFAPAQTMSSLLANEFAEAGLGLHRGALTEVALLLLAMSLFFNIVARKLVVGRK